MRNFLLQFFLSLALLSLLLFLSRDVSRLLRCTGNSVESVSGLTTKNNTITTATHPTMAIAEFPFILCGL